MAAVENFILDLEGTQKEMAWLLHEHILQYNLLPKISFRIPFYYRKRWVCYMNPLKNGNLDLAMCRGNELYTGGGLFQAKGRKLITSLEIDDPANIPWEPIDQILQEAILLDEKVPKSPPRRK